MPIIVPNGATAQDMTGLASYVIDAALDRDHYMQRTGGSIRVIRHNTDHTFTVVGTWSIGSNAIQWLHPFYEDDDYIYIGASVIRAGLDRASIKVARWNKATSSIDMNSNEVTTIGQDHQNTVPVTITDQSDSPAGKLRLGAHHTEDAFAGSEDIYFFVFEYDINTNTLTRLGQELMYSSAHEYYPFPNGTVAYQPAAYLSLASSTSSHSTWAEPIKVNAYSPTDFTRNTTQSVGTSFGRGKDARAMSNRYGVIYHVNRGSSSASYNHEIGVIRLNNDAISATKSEYTNTISQGGGRGPTGGRVTCISDTVFAFVWASRDNTMLRGIDYVKTAGSTAATAQGSIYTDIYDPGVSLFSGENIVNWDLTGLVNERKAEGSGEDTHGRLLLSWYDSVQAKTFFLSLESELVPGLKDFVMQESGATITKVNPWQTTFTLG